MTLRDIPYSHEAEEALLGALLMRPHSFKQVAAELALDDFFLVRHRFIWQALLDLSAQGLSWEFIAVADHLQRQGKLADVGGKPYLISLINASTGDHVDVYAALIKAAAARRRLLEYSDHVRNLATADMPVAEVLGHCTAEITSIVSRYQPPKLARQRVEVPAPPLPDAAQLSAAEAAAAADVGRLLDVWMQWATRRAALTPPLFLESAYLWLVSVAAARRVAVQIGGRRYYSRLWVLWVAITTRYAKSTGLLCAQDVIEQAFPHMLIPNQSTPEALIAALGGRVPENLESLSEADRLRVQAGLKYAAQRGLLIDEASSLLGASRKDYMHGLTEMLLQTYDMKARLEFATKGQGLLIIRRPALSILGATTPMAMARYVSVEQWETGEMARYALLCPNERAAPPLGLIHDQAVDYDPPGELVAGLQRLYETLPEPPAAHQADAPEQLVFATIDQAALARLDMYHKALQGMVGDNLDTRLHGNYGRLPDMAMSVALNLALSDWACQSQGNRPVIRMGHAARAQQIVERWRASVHQLLPTLDETADSRGQSRILALLRNSQGMTARELSRYCGMKTRDMHSALAVLLESGDISYLEYTPPNGGRPTRAYRIV